MPHAMNTAYVWDLLPHPSLYTIPPEVGWRMKLVHPDLEIHWISVCGVCGFTRPGDMRRCPGKVLRYDRHAGKQIRQQHEQQDIQGYWGIYLQYPMYDNYLYPVDGVGASLRVIEKRPMYIGWIPAHVLTQCIIGASQVIYGDPNKNLHELLTKHYTHEQAITKEAVAIAEGGENEARWYKRQIRQLRTGMPINPVVSVPRSITN